MANDMRGPELNGKTPVHILRHGDLTLNLITRRVTRSNKRIGLTQSQFNLLAALLREKGRVFSPRDLHIAAEGISRDSSRDPTDTVRTQISRMRKTLGEPAVIDTVYGDGYTTAPEQRACPQLLRSQPEETPDCVLRHEDIVMDLIGRRVTRGGKPVVLEPAGFGMLAALMQNKGKPVSRHELYEAGEGCLQGGHYDPTGTVRVQMYRLRRKLGDPVVIGTTPGGSYELTDSARVAQRIPGRPLRAKIKSSDQNIQSPMP